MNTRTVIAIDAIEAASKCFSYTANEACNVSPVRTLIGLEIGSVIEAAFAMKLTAKR